MFTFSIIKSPDSFVLCEHTYKRPKLFIGRNKGDFLIDDPQITDYHILILYVEDKLCLRSMDKPEVLLNKKKTKGLLALKIGDIITIGQTEIQILQFQSLKKIYQESIPTVEEIDNLPEINKERLKFLLGEYEKLSQS